MFPVLFEIPLFGGVRIYTYGVLVATGFLAGILWTTHEAKQAKVSPEAVLDLSFYIILSALIGSRVLYILTDWRRYTIDPLAVLKIWEGGLVFYGGLIGATLMSLYYLRKHSLKFLAIADLFMPGLALGHAIGRLGCLAAGCCHGREAFGFPLAIIFPKIPYSLAPAGIPLYPTQVMESFASLLIFFLLVRWRHHKKFEGQIFSLYLLLYGISRPILETFRGDEARSYLIPHLFTASQLISIILIAFSAMLYIKLRQRGQR